MLSRILLLFCFFYLPLGFAHPYKRGVLICNDFNYTERLYREYPTGGYAEAYALCLLARSEKDDTQALDILKQEISERSSVSAAYLKARYISTNGELGKELDETKYEEGFTAYAYVLELIDSHLDYPADFMVIELMEQHELNTYRYMTHILNSKAHYNTEDNILERIIKYAEKCANLDYEPYFQRGLYRQIIADCELLKKTAERFLL